jgi:hypothetical protein
MFTASSAPPAACAAIGPVGVHTSSQMETATRTPATTNNDPGSSLAVK